MAIFCVGIMIPMVMMSVLPMLGISGLFGGSSIDSRVLSAITLVLIPAAVACVMVSIRTKNPFMNISRNPARIGCAVPLFLAIPLFIVLSYTGMETYRSLCAALAVSSALTFAAVSAGTVSDRSRKRRTDLLTEAVFDMGNYLVTGMPFEESFRAAVLPREECADVARRLDRELALCRGDCIPAIRNAIEPVSEKLADVYCEIYRASMKDIRESGRLALTLGKQLMDQESVRRGIRNDLKSMTDTMSATAAVFAPIVLGLSITILGPLSRISEDVDMSGTGTVLSIYLLELCALISCTLSVLEGDMDRNRMLRRFALFLPVCMTVFLVTTAIRL